MSIYQENKIFAGKFSSALASNFKNSSGIRLSPFIYISLNSRTYRLYSEVIVKPEQKIYVEEVGKRLFFGAKFKVVKRVIGGDDGDYSYKACKAIISGYGRYSTPEKTIEEYRKFLKDKGVKTGFSAYGSGSDISSLEGWELIRNIRRDMEENQGKIYMDVLKDYPEIKEMEGILKKLNSVDIDLYRSPVIYKSIKDKELIPLAFLDGDSNVLSTPETYPSSRTSTSFYTKDSLNSSTLSGGMLNRLAKNCVTRTPFSYWIVVDYDTDLIDKKQYMRENYE